jgi:ferritin-like protein
MAGASEGYHESNITPETADLHRALVSLQEELEAIDWYQQRIDAASDAALKRVLAHNRDEEKEHAAMVLEWIRRNDAVFDRVLHTYLFTEGDVTLIEEVEEKGAGEAESTPSPVPLPALTVGSLMSAAKLG